MTKFRDGWVRTALILALLLPLYFAFVALGARFGLLDWRLALGLLVAKLGALALLGVLGFAVIALALALLVRPRRGWLVALVAALIPAMGLGYAASVVREAKALPPIHDISTDIQDPPLFSRAVLEARARTPGGNRVEPMSTPVSKPGGTVGGLGHVANPDLAPLRLPLPVAAATDAAIRGARAQGWSVNTARAADGSIEAVARSFWFGFKDDIAVRVRAAPDGASSVLDVRSTSRVGQSDLGVNARRVRAYLAAVKARVAASPA